MGKPYQAYSGPEAHDVLYKIADDVIDYVDWYCEHGLYLPNEFAKDPAAWAQILRDIQAGMRQLQLPGNQADQELLYNGVAKYYQYAEHLFKHP